jgi:hypothetical protein
MKKSCTHQEQAGVVLSQQDDKEEDKRRQANDKSNLPNWVVISPATSISRLWLNRAFDIRTLITPPTQAFNSFLHLLCTYIYYSIPYGYLFIYFIAFRKLHHIIIGK